MEILEQEKKRLEWTDEAYFDLLIREYGKKILHLVYLFVKDRALAEDITQEVFFKAFRGRNQFRGEASIRTWMYKIAVNECKRYMRSWSFRNVFPTAEIFDRFHVEMETEIMTKWTNEEIGQLVMSLSPKYRQAIVLHYYEELSIKEMADVLGISEGATRTRLHRAREQLKTLVVRRERKHGYREVTS